SPEDPQSVAVVSEVLKGLLPAENLVRARSQTKNMVGPFLKAALEQVPIVRRLAELVHSHDLWSLHRLSHELWQTSTATTQQATILLLRLAASARSRPEVAPLIPHRLHCLVRAPEGLSVCLNAACPAPIAMKASGMGAIQASRDRCADCNSIT